MRPGAFLVLIALSFINLLNAETLVQNLVPSSVINTTRNLKGAHGAAEEAGDLANAADEERGWQGVLEKLKEANIFKNAEEFKGENAAKWENVAKEAEEGGKVKTGDAAKAKSRNALAKLKAEGKLTEANEEKITKVTEEAAHALEKNPKKWPYIKKALEITFGALLTAAIVAGIDGMIGSSE
ncbi:hypothetical protein JG688_00012275 [Phytophthora aleatoria]|uniref:RxLR effector protein n=1 Tax=Phytophthora aleatoria TaxID=2496075 RepID=A0A8J5J354_9STRA|nr:hypothetical protein JG688_00012275 [Phytophthora aleatoria]